ncbi:MAG: response regulator [Patescibacteria group bacterium]|jgi:DNA-binding NtrC family response regulator|nr:response regulator [Patescibacteria group bacterium]
MRKKAVIVDDEEQMLGLMTIILKAMHFEVFAFSNPQSAMKKMNDSDVKINLLITDFSMPEMNRVELIEGFRKIYPEIRVLCVSGAYKNDVLLEQYDDFLEKPFSVKDFKEVVKKALPS